MKTLPKRIEEAFKRVRTLNVFYEGIKYPADIPFTVRLRPTVEGLELLNAEKNNLRFMTLPKVVDIEIADKSYIEKRFGLKRMLLLGPLAFALPKSEKHTRIYFAIVYIDETGEERVVCLYSEKKDCHHTFVRLKDDLLFFWRKAPFVLGIDKLVERFNTESVTMIKKDENITLWIVRIIVLLILIAVGCFIWKCHQIVNSGPLY